VASAPLERESLLSTSPDTCIPRVSVLVPAYNEAATIGKVIAKVLELGVVKEIIVVDDCSTDNTPAIVPGMSS
jgi:cellulose synthase/poly-beta-1,6-N-acetylglucosamine synthase-like glycosyltransferase